MILSTRNKEIVIELKKSTVIEHKIVVFYNSAFKEYITIEEAILLSAKLVQDGYEVCCF